MEVVDRPSVLARARDVPDLWGPNAPLKLLVDPESYRNLISGWSSVFILGGALTIPAVIALRFAFPGLDGFHANWLLFLDVALIVFGIASRAINTYSQRLALLAYAAVTAIVVPLFALCAGPRISTTVGQGCVVVAAATPIILSRRKAILVEGVSLGGTAAVFASQFSGVLATDRVLVLVAQTALYTSLMVWFASALTRLAVAERKLRLDIEMSRAELAAVDGRRRNFLDKMSHELRTPLNAIIGFSEMLRFGFVGALSPKQVEYVTDIGASGRHLLDLVDDVLDVGRIEEGQEQLSLSRFPLQRVVRDSVAICREEAVRRHVSLVLRCDRAVGVATADQRKVKQILLNLVWNALKFTPAGGSVEVEVRRNRSGFDIRVTDTGRGVPAEDRDRIFAAYEQGASDDARPHPLGTGLGLPLARRLARLHGGDLTLEDRPGGQGARFVLTLPAAARTAGTRPDGAAPAPLGWVGADDPGILDEASALEWLVGRDGLARYRARMVGVAIVVEIVATGILGALPQPKDFRLLDWPWLGISIGSVGLLITFHPRIRFTAKQVHRLALFAVPFTGYYVWTVGPQMSPAMSTILMMMGVAVFTAFRWKRALPIGVVAAVTYAIVLVREPDNNLSLSRWVVTVALTAGGALIARWLLQFLPPLVASEKEARREAEIANAQLAAATSHKSEFLANMSHELRTPLNAIIGFADVLKQGFFGELNSKQAEYVDDIESAGRHLLALINDILDLAKAEAGRLELNPSPCCLAEVVEAGTSAARTEAANRGVTFCLRLEEADKPSSMDPFTADPRRLARAIASVVDNAVAFTPAGGQVAVTASRLRDRVEISVADSGPGIHPANHERIFAAFEHAGHEDRAGSGMGLALARRLVQLHGGALTLSSKPGQGSVFRLSVPATNVGSGDSRTDSGTAPALA